MARDNDEIGGAGSIGRESAPTDCTSSSPSDLFLASPCGTLRLQPGMGIAGVKVVEPVEGYRSMSTFAAAQLNSSP